MCKLTIKIECEDDEMKGTANYSIEVTPVQSLLTLTPGDVAGGTVTDLGSDAVGAEITPLEIKASGGTGPYTFVVGGNLPDGLQAVSDNVDTLQISGAPGTVGVFDFSITATDSLGAAAKTRFNKKVA
jgi:hypothetical protein